MLIEYLQNEHAEHAQWLKNIPGVFVCQFTLSGSQKKALPPSPACTSPHTFEIFFCMDGQIVIQQPHSEPHKIERYDALVLSGACRPDSVKITGTLQGILVFIDARLAHNEFFSVFASFGFHVDPRQLHSKLNAQSGYAALCDHCWCQAIFEFLTHLPQEAYGTYCLLKAMELLCIFTVTNQDAKPSAEKYAPKSILDARAYMELHLSEKITISDLSRLHAVSTSYLKTEFRRIYGMSVHSCLMDLRMRRAGELIRCTDLPIYQIAQKVGYTGMNQFSTVFKRYYGVTPGQYKKMSKAGTNCLFQ